MAGCFVALAMHAASGHIARTDLRLLNASQRLPEALEPWVTLQTRMGNPGLLATCVVILAALLILRGAWAESAVTLSAFAVFAAVVAIKHVVQEAPPYLATHAEYAGVIESNYSFPSGHVAGLSVLAGLVFLFADRLVGDRSVAFMLRLVALVFAATAGPGRIYLGVHYPSDVVAAYLLAALFLLPVWFAYGIAIGRKPQPEGRGYARLP
jgi:membrane-associated phospholipid phosphatase